MTIAEVRGLDADREHVLVQPIVVDKAGTHVATIRAAAAASVVCQMTQPGQWETWLSGPFTKTVRRAKTAQVLAIASLPGSTTVGEPGAPGFAVALPPVRYVDLPREISRLQVSATDLVRGDVPTGDPHCPVTLSVLDDLTTGKAAAQAAHALMAWALQTDDASRDALSAHPVPTVSLTSCDLLERIAQHPEAVVIRDNGHTEVAPDTLTAVALPYRLWSV